MSPTFRLRVTSEALRHPVASRKVERMTQALLLAAMVVIRTFNYAQVPPDELARARATADRTFQHAGISVQWIDCWVPGDRPAAIGNTPSAIGNTPSAIGDRVSASGHPQSAIGERLSACTEPLREGTEFMLRLLPSADPAAGGSARRVTMGTSLIDHDARAGALTTVDPRLVRDIAHEAATDPAALLGRTIAHEIGHLLLGHTGHSRRGLMRALWSQDEIRGIKPAGWQFSGAEAAQMRQELAARARAAN